MLPALESLFRRVPAASPAHASAAALLAALLPAYVRHLRATGAPDGGAAAGGGSAAAATGVPAVASVLTTLRKFLQRCCSLPDPDIDAAGFVGVQSCVLLRRLLSAGTMGRSAGSMGCAGGYATGGLAAAFAASQLLPGTQVGERCRR